jgi:RNA polymerase sigma-70 factor, ECF subfamily
MFRISLARLIRPRSARPDDESRQSDTWIRLNDPQTAQNSSFWVGIDHKYGDTIRRSARRTGLSRHQVEEVAQEVFRDLLQRNQNGPSNDPDHVANFRNFLWTISRHKAIDYYRRSRRQMPPAVGGERNRILLQQIEDPRSESGRPGSTILFALDRAMEAAKGDFNEQTWTAFYQTCVKERPIKEVADELGLSPNAVYIARSRALRRIREEFKSAGWSQ